MSTEAIIMMIVAIVVLWGGLGLAILNLTRHGPHSPEEFHRDL